MSTEKSVMELPKNVTGNASALIHIFLQGNRSSQVEISVQHVRRLGSHCLQLLMSAQLQWRKDGIDFTLINAKDSFLEELAFFGLEPDFFDMERSE